MTWPPWSFILRYGVVDGGPVGFFEARIAVSFKLSFAIDKITVNMSPLIYDADSQCLPLG